MYRKQFLRSVFPAKKIDRDREHSSIDKRHITFETRSRKYRGQSYPDAHRRTVWRSDRFYIYDIQFGNASRRCCRSEEGLRKLRATLRGSTR